MTDEETNAVTLHITKILREQALTPVNFSILNPAAILKYYSEHASELDPAAILQAQKDAQKAALAKQIADAQAQLQALS